MPIASSDALTLCIDTCGPALHLVLGRADKVVAKQFTAMPKGQAEVILPSLATLLGQVGIDVSAKLSRIAVVIGPGSFTGLRVGLAVAKARALGDGAELVPLDRLALIARSLQIESSTVNSISVAIDARRGEFFAQSFDADAMALAPAVTVPDDNTGSWFAGEKEMYGTDAYTIPSPRLPIDAQHVRDDMFLMMARSAPAVSHRQVQPLYVRAPDAIAPKGSRFFVK